MAHIVASLTALCKRTAIISGYEGAATANARIASMPVPYRENEAWPTGHVFLASSCLTPNKGIWFI